MDIGSLFLIMALLILVAWYISRPIFDPRLAPQSLPVDAPEHELSHLLAEHDRALNALQELDFDYTLGKIPQDDYPEQRARLLYYGADVLRQLDQLQGQAEGAGSSGDQDAQARFEAVAAARRADADLAHGSARNGGNGAGAVPARVAAPDDDLEVMLANRRRVRQEKSAGFCPRCGGPLQISDQFCPKCGKPLK
jgi:hypothetical protein